MWTLSHRSLWQGLKLLLAAISHKHSQKCGPLQFFVGPLSCCLFVFERKRKQEPATLK